MSSHRNPGAFTDRAGLPDGFFVDALSVDDPPSSDDSYEVREAWARSIVADVMDQADERPTARVAAPDDIRPTHFWEVEFQSALVDPEVYARSMRATGPLIN